MRRPRFVASSIVVIAGCTAAPPPSPPAAPIVAIPAPKADAPKPAASTVDATAATAARPLPSKDHERLARLHAKACEVDTSDYAAKAYAARPVPPAPAFKAAEDKKVCFGGGPCGALADDYAHGIGVPEIPTRAAELYAFDCERRRGVTAESCWRLGDLLVAGVGVKRDHARAAMLYERACPSGMYGACLPLADLHRAGAGVAQDEARAFALEAKYMGDVETCCASNHDSRCCAAASRGFREGRGRERDEERAAELELRAAEVAERECTRGIAERCADLAERYAWGRGVVGDPACATTLFAQACAGGHEPSCTPPLASAPPSDADFQAATEVSVLHSTALGCETKMVRGWLRVRCTSVTAGDAPLDGRFVRGASAVTSFGERGGGVVTLLVMVRPGSAIEARVLWAKTGLRTLGIRWPKGAKEPAMGFDRGR